MAPLQLFFAVPCNVPIWRDRAGRGIGSDYTAMERSTSKSGGMSPFLSPTGRSRERHFPDVPVASPKRTFAFRSGVNANRTSSFAALRDSDGILITKS
jgi:hypothetical protein